MRQRITGDATRAEPNVRDQRHPEFKRAGKVENVTKEWPRKRTTLRTNASIAVCSHSMGVCVCVCVCKGVCGGSEVVIDENNDRLAGTGQFETGAIITLWTSRAAFKLLFKKTPWERRQRGVYQCVYSLWESASRRCERSLCVCMCVCANKSD